jgi:hypothetical protein
MTPDAAEVRFTRLFEDAREALHLRIKEIFAEHAAKGLLQSGPTIRIAVAAVQETTLDALQIGLKSVSTATEHSGKVRREMLAQLRASLNLHLKKAEGLVILKLAGIGLEKDLKHAEPLFAKARIKYKIEIDEYESGWTAPTDRKWIERHPVYFSAISAVGGALLALALQLIAGLEP